MAEFCFVQLWIHPRKVCCTQPVKVACDRRSLVVQTSRERGRGGANTGGAGRGSAHGGAGDARDAGLIPGSGRSPGEGNGYPLQYSCLKNPDRKSVV